MRCRFCGQDNPFEEYFCRRCRRSLIPASEYDLHIRDFAYKPDVEALRIIESISPLTEIVKNFAIKEIERGLLKQTEFFIDAKDDSRLRQISRECARILCLKRLPKIQIKPSRILNAFTFGTEENAIVVIHSPAMKVLTDEELKALISHELAHIKSEHMLYHTLAEYLAGGITLSASTLGLGMIDTPLRLALLSWYRNSEVTADRASLLTVDSLNTVKSFLAKVFFFSRKFKGKVTSTSERKIVDLILEALKTHPLYGTRVKRLTEFYNSKQFSAAREKIQRRERCLKALRPLCRFCGANKPINALFCPKCGRCQI